jgi:predicted MFS family arabinose efflux permease
MHPENPKSKHDQAAHNSFGGNIWGWRFSFLGLGLILLMLSLMFFRYMTMPEASPVDGSTIDTLSSGSNNVNQ